MYKSSETLIISYRWMKNDPKFPTSSPFLPSRNNMLFYFLLSLNSSPEQKSPNSKDSYSQSGPNNIPPLLSSVDKFKPVDDPLHYCHPFPQQTQQDWQPSHWQPSLFWVPLTFSNLWQPICVLNPALSFPSETMLYSFFTSDTSPNHITSHPTLPWGARHRRTCLPSCSLLNYWSKIFPTKNETLLNKSQQI